MSASGSAELALETAQLAKSNATVDPNSMMP
jgi:hypothetical protein